MYIDSTYIINFCLAKTARPLNILRKKAHFSSRIQMT